MSSHILNTKPCTSTDQDETYYVSGDFEKTAKIDAHLHYNTFNESFLKYSISINMHLLTINTDMGVPINTQLEIAKSLKQKYPGMISFLGTFDPQGFTDDNFIKSTIEQIKRCMDAGAKGIKIWKSIGMILQNESGKYVMADYPIFLPLFAFLEKEGIPLLSHLGDPLNCWLPYDNITMYSDLQYYTNFPIYHMYQHPEIPAYDRQVSVQNNLLEKFPHLNFVGAHLGSLEWNIDEVAKRLDRYPHYCVDLSARIGHIQLQAIHNREEVRNFFIKYQDRLLYGSDFSITGESVGIKSHILRRVAPGIFAKRICKTLYRIWKNDWLFLATNEIVPVEKFNITNAPENIKGLRLPKQVINLINDFLSKSLIRFSVKTPKGFIRSDKL